MHKPVGYGVLALFALALWAGCAPGNRVYEADEVDQPPILMGDSLIVVDTLEARPLPRWAVPDLRDRIDQPDRVYDLVSTALDLAFDFEEESVRGTAVHVLSPLFDGVDRLPFDARDMEIERVERLHPRRAPEALRFAYDGVDLHVLPRTPLPAGETIELRIFYKAYPMRNGEMLGLNFIDPKGTDPYRPTQIWSQGQAEENQYWFPTWDYPNDLMRFEIALAVPEPFRTLSNGRLVEQITLPNGLRRDRWVLDKPQAAYLAVVVAGEFATVYDEYFRGDGTSVPLEYIVEPPFEVFASMIFGETPRMMEYFERMIGVPFPWEKYAQVSVRDFTAGGMENTTATVMYEWLQLDERAYLDYTGRDLISHELAHQWFGDLVTAEDWANLALSEGFATYFEELYLEGVHGRDAAQAHAIADRETYFEEAEYIRRPIVWYGYTDPDVMFDAHSYQKAGQVFGMLRFELGDALWWRAIRHFIEKNRHRTVELADLRIAFEETTGRNLKPFFDQWFLAPGHPELEVTGRYVPEARAYELRVRQVQDTLYAPVFAFDVQVELNPSTGRPVRQRIRIAGADTTLRLPADEAPRFVRFDEGNQLLARIDARKPVEEWIAQARTDDEMAGRFDAVQALAALDPEDRVRETLVDRVQTDSAPLVRKAATEALEAYVDTPEGFAALLGAAKDRVSAVRAAALWALSGRPDDRVREALKTALVDSSYVVVGTAVLGYAQQDPEHALEVFAPLHDLRSWHGTVELALIEAIEQLAQPEGAAYLRARAGPLNPDVVRTEAVEALAALTAANPGLKAETLSFLTDLLGDLREEVRHYTAGALAALGDEDVIAKLEAQMARESSEHVREALAAAIARLREGS